MPPETPILIKDIATKAGVSNFTVSMALRGSPRISLRRREQIQLLAQELGYRRNHLASGLRGGRTRSIGLLWSMHSSPNSIIAVRLLSREIDAARHVSYLFDHFSDRQLVTTILDDLLRRGTDGIVIQLDQDIVDRTPELSLVLARFPIRIVVSERPLALETDCVIHDRRTGVQQAVEHLLQSGRRHLVYLSTPGSTNRVKAQAMHDAALRIGDGASTHEIDLASEDMAGVLAGLNDSPQAAHADAFICSNDLIAAATIHWLAHHGRKCPQDAAVVGFNNSDFAPLIDPPLASIERCEQGMASHVGRLLRRRLEQPDAPFQTVEVPMVFHWRQSAGGSRSLGGLDATPPCHPGGASPHHHEETA